MIRPLRLIISLAAVPILIAACHFRPSMNRSEELSAPGAPPYLKMPENDSGPLPKHLSETGAFTDTRTLTLAAGLIPYDINVPFYSDGASKRRWIALPAQATRHAERIRVQADGTWTFPAGTVFVKHFEIPAESGNGPPRRIETRILVRDNNGSVYGASYRWRADGSDADLVTTSHTETLMDAYAMHTPPRRWFFPASKDCRSCHTPAAGGVLGFNSRQLDRPVSSGAGFKNQLEQLAALHIFESPAVNLHSSPKLIPLSDTSASLESRVRSYLDVNCAQCHRPGAVNDFDARLQTPLERTGILNRRAQLADGIDHAKIVSPNDPWRSMLLVRSETLETTKMPPLGRVTVDAAGVHALRQWILSLPGQPVLSPPTINPGGEFSGSVEVTISHPEASVRYTLDGTPPTSKSPLYAHPIRIEQSTVVRAAAFKDGSKPSITVQEVFSIEP